VLGLLNRDGQQQVTINAAHGLPPTENGVCLFPLAVGQALVVGSTAAGRGWLATVDVTGDRPIINVFHEAKRQAYVGEKPEQLRSDTTLTFAPCWIVEYCGDAAPAERSVLIGRTPGHRSLGYESVTDYPLRVNLKTLAVSVFEHYLFNEPQVCWQGELFQPWGFSIWHVLPPGRRWKATDVSPSWPAPCPGLEGLAQRNCCYNTDAETGDLVRVNDLLYVTGPVWWQFNLRTRAEDRLVPGILPRPYRDCTAVGLSSRWGLIVWPPYQFDAVYRVSVPAMPKDSP
jgi:hypothetical protein